MRILYALSTMAAALSLPCIGNSQVEVKTEQHFCEGQSSWETPACESAWLPNISAVFLGLATDVHDEDVPIILDGKSEHTLRQHVVFHINESFVGVPKKTVTVTTGGDLCGFPFSKGQKYLVYGRSPPSGEIYVSISSSTKLMRDAADDLKYLRQLPTAQHGSTIHGTVFRFSEPQNPGGKELRLGTPEAGLKIEIRGVDQNYQATVDFRGHFSLSGLPPGRYTVFLNADGAIRTSSRKYSATVDVADKGCAQFDFWIDPFAEKE